MIIDHGMWETYTPAERPEGHPGNAAYSRSINTKADWYAFQKEFNGTVVITAMPLSDGSYVTQAASLDASTIFPGDWRLLEETEYSGADPRADLGQRIYNPDTRALGEKYIPPRTTPPQSQTETKILASLDAIMARLDKLEKHKPK